MVQVRVVACRAYLPRPMDLFRLNLTVDGIDYIGGVIEPRPGRGATFALQEPRPGGPA